jgi:preprotein translocase subunit SecY
MAGGDPGQPCIAGNDYRRKPLRLPPPLVRLLRSAGWKRLAITGLCLLVWRALEQVIVVGVNGNVIAARLQFVNDSDIVHAIGSGTPLASYSVVAMGIAPYIYALLIVFLLYVCSKRVRTIGSTPDGRLALRRWTRAVAIALALGQAYGVTVFWQAGDAFPAQTELLRLLVILELTAGTMILVFLADVIDQFGLGFGYGALLIYATFPVANEVHRMAAILSFAPSIEALYKPLAVWAVFSIGVVAATVAVLLAVRRVILISDKKRNSGNPVELKLLMSGAVRPPLFALALLSLPVNLANNVATSSPGVAQLAYQWSPFGPNPWIDLAYVLLEAALVMAFVYGIVLAEVLSPQTPRDLRAHILRLSFIGGTFLAIAVAVLPVLERIASGAASTTIPMSGFDAVLVTAVILAVVGSLEGSGTRRPTLPVPATYMP